MSVRVERTRSGDDRRARAAGAPQRGRPRRPRGARRRLPRLRRRRRGARRRALRRGRHLLRRRGPQGDRRRQAATASQPTATGRWARQPACCSSKPVIAAVAGHAVAGGLELALWCDLRVAEEDAVLGVFCRRWGVPLIDGGTVRLPRLDRAGARARPHPHRPAGRRRGGARASASPTASCRAGTARAAAEELARELARFPQVCLRGDRLSALRGSSSCRSPAALAQRARATACRRCARRALSGAARFAAGAGRHGAF